MAIAPGCEDEQHAARVLGFNRTSWNGGHGEVEQPASTKKRWVEMTAEEKAALVVLGYSEHSWDTREPFSSYKVWGDLTDKERAAAELLGYKAVRWNDLAGLAKPLAHVDRVWSELTDEEKAALEVLGFTEVLWDEGTSPRPASFFKAWKALTVCSEFIHVMKMHHHQTLKFLIGEYCMMNN